MYKEVGSYHRTKVFKGCVNKEILPSETQVNRVVGLLLVTKYASARDEQNCPWEKGIGLSHSTASYLENQLEPTNLHSDPSDSPNVRLLDKE